MPPSLKKTVARLEALCDERRELDARFEKAERALMAAMAPVVQKIYADWTPEVGEAAVSLSFAAGRPTASYLIFRDRRSRNLRFAHSLESHSFLTVCPDQDFSKYERPEYILPAKDYELLREEFGWPKAKHR